MHLYVCVCVCLLLRQCPPDFNFSSSRLVVTNRHHSIFVIHCTAFIITRRNNQVFMFVITPDFKQNILLYFLSVVFICSQRSYLFFLSLPAHTVYFPPLWFFEFKQKICAVKGFFFSFIASFNPIIEMFDDIPVLVSCWKKTYANHMLYRNISSNVFHF